MTITRSGRAIKKPAVFVPTETVLDDDYCTDDYDDDADENGNLKDFVVDDDDESESEDA